jgi:hypothetical protein
MESSKLWATMTARIWAALAIVSACHHAPSDQAPPVTAPPVTAPPVTAPPVTTPPATTPPATMTSPPTVTPRRPTGFDGLGQRCPFTPTFGVYTGVAWCGADGTVSAIEWKLADVVGAPDEAELIAERTQTDVGLTHTVAVTHDAVWIRTSRPTARVSGATFMGVLASMTDEQLAAAQRLARVPDQPLLRTPDAWKERMMLHHGPPPAP